MKKISVIIPCYNAGLYIDRCLTSIITQTIGIDALEVICVDDASTDDTWLHLQKWEQCFSENILLIHLETNKRLGAARNVGLSYASADWIAFVDADDWLEPDYFELLYRPVGTYEVDVVACEMREDPSEALTFFTETERAGEEDDYYIADTIDIKKRWIRYKILGRGAWAKIIRKRLILENALFFVEGLVYEDHHWIPLLHAYATHAYVVGKKLYHYFINPHSIVRSKNEEYHMDWITVQMVKWGDYERRGLFQSFHKELEEDVLDDAVGFMKMLALRYDHPSFSLFRLEKELIRQQVPDYRSNPYIDDYIGAAQIFLEMLYQDIDKKRFQETMERIRNG